MAYSAETAKIDGEATLGLVGVSNSLAYRVHEIEKHFHSRERWFGKLGSQTATAWGEADSIAPYRAISGAGVYGADADDEALVLGTDDLPLLAGMVKADVHLLFVTALSADTPYLLRMIYGSGTMADAITATQFSTFPVMNIVTGSKSGGVAAIIMMPRITCGTDKVWVQCKCATDNATADFLVGIHEYAG
jgi:hypothetical protein